MYVRSGDGLGVFPFLPGLLPVLIAAIGAGGTVAASAVSAKLSKPRQKDILEQQRLAIEAEEKRRKQMQQYIIGGAVFVVFLAFSLRR